MNNPHQKALMKLLSGMSCRHHLYTVFADFVEMAAISVSNALDLMHAAEREERYMRLIGKYETAEQQQFPRMIAELVMALEIEPDDILGRTFSELDMGNSRAGQFFTPFEVGKLMANLTVGDGAELRREIADKGFVTMSEPACGAGGQVIAFAQAMRDAGINYQQHLHVTAIDVDARAVHMTYLQLSLLHIPAIVLLGNTLSLEMREEWRTPAHLMGLWDGKLQRGYALGSAKDAGLWQVKEPAPRWRWDEIEAVAA